MSNKSTDLWHTPTASGHSPAHEKRYPGGKTRKHPIPNLAAEVEQGQPYAQQVRERNAPTASQQLTFLPEGSRASLTVLPGGEEAQKMTATSGQNISDLLERQGRDTSLPKMFLESSPPISTRCYLTWKVKVTPAGRSIFQLAPSMPPIDESESSLWPTPTARDGKSGRCKQPRRYSELTPTIERQEPTGQLNPTWVEWLMGFPSGFTDLEA